MLQQPNFIVFCHLDNTRESLPMKIFFDRFITSYILRQDLGTLKKLFENSIFVGYPQLTSAPQNILPPLTSENA
jgi:hypothetical protein